MTAKKCISQLLASAGIQVDGPNPWDIQVHNENFYARLLCDKQLGRGESYMEGWWDCEQLDVCIYHLLTAHLDQKIKNNFSLLFRSFLHTILNYQTRKLALEVAHKHYDIGNELYQAMLGGTLVYSCAYWKNAANLDEAQRNKMELACHKLMLEPGMTLLDIGCGWGSLALYAAEHYGVEVVGITISEKQKQLAEERCKHRAIEIRLQDYRELRGEQFDRVVSIGMFEHVGYKNYRQFMEVVKNILKKDGFFLLHTIGSNVTSVDGDAWINKYIFPNGMLPSITHIGNAIEGLFVMEDWQNFGLYYEQTLMAWYQNFLSHWPKLKAHYNERFYRMWKFYLLSCAGGFRARKIQLWQLALSPCGLQRVFDRR
jgi:cyclopropane-fatty-acyl-phospholipid synthase